MMEEIKFSPMKPFSSQQTIALFLRDKQYYFRSVSAYENTMFYCVIRKPEFRNTCLGDIFKKHETKYNEYILTLSLDKGGSDAEEMYMVFTQEDVKNIVKDAPEGYIGEWEL